MRETSEHYQEPDEIDEREIEIARADSVAEIFQEAADELVAMETGNL